MLRNNHTSIQADAVVIGSGILGLMLAKRLVDLGQKVVLVEKSTRVADGASSMNHGWVHQGSGSAVTANNLDHARSIVKKMQYGFDFFKSYAPEAFDEPFEPTYAVTADANRAARARDAWNYAGIAHKELSRAEFAKLETGLDPAKASYFFQVPEGRINNRLLFLKLFADLRQKGGVVFMGAEYEYESDYEIRVTTADQVQRVHAPLFFYATGVWLDDAHLKLTGESTGLQFCKSHLMYLPRMVPKSIMGLDPGTPIVFNHERVSVVNRSYDEVGVPTNGNFTLDDAEIERSLEILYEFYPQAKALRPDTINARAFLKPFTTTTTQVAGRHSAEQTVFVPKPGHIFALPGKMTAAPYVADNLIKQVAPLLNIGVIQSRPFDDDAAGQPVTSASADRPVKPKRRRHLLTR